MWTHLSLRDWKQRGKSFGGEQKHPSLMEIISAAPENVGIVHGGYYEWYWPVLRMDWDAIGVGSTSIPFGIDNCPARSYW